MSKKRITPIQRARQALFRQSALQASLTYEAKLRKARTQAVAKALKRLRDTPPTLWANEVYIEEPYMPKLLTDLYITCGTPSAIDTANRMLSRKETLDGLFEQTVREWAKTHMGQKINLMTSSLSVWLKNEISRLVDEEGGEGVEALTSKLYRGVSRSWQEVREWMCRRIVQTETMNSLNVASMEAANALQIEYEKTWSIAGINTRPSHQEVDGVTIAQGELFDVGGYQMERPMDDTYGAPAGEIINCSCTLIYLPKGNQIEEI